MEESQKYIAIVPFKRCRGKVLGEIFNYAAF